MFFFPLSILFIFTLLPCSVLCSLVLRMYNDVLRTFFFEWKALGKVRRVLSFFRRIALLDRMLMHDFEPKSDFLLFMPTHPDGSPLEAALSFYSSIVTVNPEGDSLVSDETLEGLGTAGFLLQALFGSLLRIANPDLRSADTRRLSGIEPHQPPQSHQPHSPLKQQPGLPTNMTTTMATPPAAMRYSAAGAGSAQVLTDTAAKGPARQYKGAQQSSAQYISDISGKGPAGATTRLTDLLPDPGYFLAGAVSGGVSRTTTAPLDRLKVYLLVNTKTSANVALAAAKDGHPFAALRNAGGPIVDAAVNLWKTGGLRTFFAGMLMLDRCALRELC